MQLRTIAARLALAAILPTALTLHAQDDPARRGRKYKPPPETSRLEVLVLKGANGKPIPNAAVVFHSSLNGKDDGNLEIKTDPDGKGEIDIIPTGSMVDVQVIANGYATQAQHLQLDKSEHSITIRMEKPKSQISTYTDKTTTGSRGVQEPVRPGTKPAPPKPITSSDPVLKLAPAPADQNSKPADPPPAPQK